MRGMTLWSCTKSHWRPIGSALLIVGLAGSCLAGSGRPGAAQAPERPGPDAPAAPVSGQATPDVAPSAAPEPESPGAAHDKTTADAKRPAIVSGLEAQRGKPAIASDDPLAPPTDADGKPESDIDGLNRELQTLMKQRADLDVRVADLRRRLLSASGRTLRSRGASGRDTEKLTPEQRRAIDEARQQAQEAMRQAREALHMAERAMRAMPAEMLDFNFSMPDLPDFKMRAMPELNGKMPRFNFKMPPLPAIPEMNGKAVTPGQFLFDFDDKDFQRSVQGWEKQWQAMRPEMQKYWRDYESRMKDWQKNWKAAQPEMQKRWHNYESMMRDWQKGWQDRVQQNQRALKQRTVPDAPSSGEDTDKTHIDTTLPPDTDSEVL